MQYKPEDYIHLELVSNPESDLGFELVERTTGRPVAGIGRIGFERGVNLVPLYHKPHEVTVTLTGIPIMLNVPEWDTFVAARSAANDRTKREAADATLPCGKSSVPLPPSAAPSGA